MAEPDTYPALHVRVERAVAWVTIDNPPLNLLDAVLITSLDRLAAALEDDPSVRVVVFQSADEDFFVAHGDMDFLDDPAGFAVLPVGGGADASLNPMMRLHERVRALPQITIGKIAGIARGGGAELLQAMDMRFAAAGRAALAQMEAPTGIIPGAGGTAYLPRLVGRARALEVVLGADLFDAATAERYGWVNRALPAEEVDAFVADLAHRIATLEPGVAAAAVAAVDASLASLPAGLDAENTLLGELFARPRAAELTRAARRAGAQTRQGEQRLESILQGLAQDRP